MELFECLITWLSIWALSTKAVLAEIGSREHEDEEITCIIRGPKFSPSTEEEIEGDTLDKNIIALAKRRRKDLFIIDEITQETLKWNEFIEKSHKLAAKLQELNCGPGCIVGIVTGNRVEYPIVYFGTWLSGATLNNFDILSSPDELIRLYNITQPSIIFGTAKYCDTLRTACPHCTFIVFDPNSPTYPDTFSSFIESAKKTFEPVQISPDDTAFIMYSSGTTGLPKAIQLSHKGLVYLNKLFHEQKMPPNEGGTMVSDRGFCHGMGLVIFLIAVVRNQTLVIMPKAQEENHDGELFLKIIEKYGVKMIFVVPATIIQMLHQSKYKLPNLEYIVSSASPLSPKHEREIMQKLKNLKGVIQWYGSTESMLNTTKSVDSSKEGTVGSVNPLIEMKVVDVESKRCLKSNEDGEIWIRGPTITKGYYGNPEITALAIDREGWYHSGDIGHYDNDKDFFIVGRLKEVIRYDSYPVVPAEIENALLKHPAVHECAALGVPDELHTELPTAYVVKETGVEVTAEELIEFVKDKVSPYAYLRGGVEFISELPKTSTGKVMRKELKEMWLKKYGGESNTMKHGEVEKTWEKKHSNLSNVSIF